MLDQGLEHQIGDSVTPSGALRFYDRLGFSPTGLKLDCLGDDVVGALGVPPLCVIDCSRTPAHLPLTMYAVRERSTPLGRYSRAQPCGESLICARMFAMLAVP
jgi:hypothetical protein